MPTATANGPHALQLAIEHLAVERGSRRVIDGLTMRVEGGTPTVLVGPNGSGKTTLIRTIAGLISPVSGTIALQGGDQEKDLAAEAHYVGHLNALKPSLTVEENLIFWARYLGGGAVAKATIEAALEAFALTALAGIPAGYLSAGQKRRACLARLLVTPRPLWLLDEPTVSLDTASVALLARQIDAHAAGGGLVIAATHIPLGLSKEQRVDLGNARESAA